MRLTIKDLQATWDKEAINELPLGRYEGPVVLIDNQDSLVGAVKALKKEKLLGFDTESRPAFKKGVKFPPSLLQLAGESMVYLFQLATIEDLDSLFRLLSDSKIKKVGVAILDDIKRLQSLHDFKPEGFIEIAKMSKQLGCKYAGLRTLSAVVLGRRISKKAQLSNWAQKNLTETQINYAATDAWVSRKLYLELKQVMDDEGIVLTK